MVETVAVFGAERILAFGDIIARGFERLTAIENATAKLKGLGFSAQIVATSMENALGAVKGTAYGLDEAATVAASAMAAGVKPGADLRRVLGLVADTATIAGTSMMDVGDIFNEVAASNRLSMEQVNRLAERGVPILSMVAKQYGVTQEAAYKMVSKGKVDFAAFAQAIEANVGGAALKSGDTTQGALANMGAAASRLGASLLSGIFPATKIVFGSLTGLADQATEHVKPLATWIGVHLQGAIAALQKIIPQLVTEFTSGFKGADQFGSSMSDLGELARFAYESVKALITGFATGEGQGEGFVGLMSRLGAALRDVAQYLRDDVVPALSEAGGWLARHQEVVAGIAIAYASWQAVLALHAVGMAVARAATVAHTVAVEIHTTALAFNRAMFAASNTTMGIWLGLKGLELTAWLRGVAAIVAHNVAIGAHVALMGIVRVATLAWVGVQALLNITFMGFPLVWILAAIIALVAAVIYAWKHFALFRSIVMNVWNAIKTLGEVAQVVWGGISTAARVVWAILEAIFKAWVAYEMAILVPAFKVLQAVGEVVWAGISYAINAAWAVINVIFALIRLYIEKIIIPEFKLLMEFVSFVWGMIKADFNFAWAVIKFVFDAIRDYIDSKIVPIFRMLGAFIGATLDAIKAQAQSWWNTLHAIFTAVVYIIESYVVPKWNNFVAALKNLFNDLSNSLSSVWNTKIKPIFEAFSRMMTDNVEPTFKRVVEGIKNAWSALVDHVKLPVNLVIIVVNKGIIDPFNRIADALHVTQHIGPIAQLARGGPVRGPGTDVSDSIPAFLSNNEYVIPARVVRKLGVGFFDRLIGKRGFRTAKPGDGSEGLAFQGGGIIGDIVGGITSLGKSLWEALSDPTKLISGPVNALLDHVPGGGIVRALAVGSARKLMEGLLNFLKTFGGAGNVGATQAFVRAQVGKPYIWAAVGPDGYDCSGLVSAAMNVYKGKFPYTRLFSTHNQAPFFPLPGSGIFTAGWANAGERGGGDVGHTAGNIAGLGFEATPPAVKVGSSAISLSSFAHVGHFDDGGYLMPGALGINTTPYPERVIPSDVDARIVDLLAQIVAAVEKVAPGVGAEINRSGRGMLQLVRST